ncbi:MAG: hypothetical protein N3E38_00115 [Candidatus Aenigmarchaeota archaeon]|nr:hypothetical protein [Candidatus Aenigmarchaeota archaeon]MCX8179135.1 hypothetical protein [Candidatus Aenigmarchaeota archaeon]
MMVEILLLANALLFLVLALEAKVRSKIGYAIVVSGLLLAIIDFLFFVLLALRVI